MLNKLHNWLHADCEKKLTKLRNEEGARYKVLEGATKHLGDQLAEAKKALETQKKVEIELHNIAVEKQCQELVRKNQEIYDLQQQNKKLQAEKIKPKLSKVAAQNLHQDTQDKWADIIEAIKNSPVAKALKKEEGNATKRRTKNNS